MAQSAQEFSIVNNETLITCPYDPVHKIRAKKIMYHLSKCSKSHRYYSGKVLTCLYDSTHVIREDEYYDHMKVCSQRHTICQEMTPQYEEKLGNNPFTRETFSDDRYQAEEDWGAEIGDYDGSNNQSMNAKLLNQKASVIPVEKIQGLSRYHKRLYLHYFGAKLKAEDDNSSLPELPFECKLKAY
ncbi:DgyrCDS5585 [Dimorphilus gyrociliatus]|uniref:DgyrCDS5585 n=1 Tax=Dimorphilus gyrociliatus TaxID=2664684 RepID=A0A7I8VKE5_9ANNE|nr:DgyrCDS5585 [Dimorphilus gyrociliatus]